MRVDLDGCMALQIALITALACLLASPLLATAFADRS
jgi:hypothetical protein